ncbi:MAG: uracil-DNA glycosylase [Rikenellaceae bacterium]
MEFNLDNSWRELLKEEFEKPYFKSLESFLESEYENYTVYPKRENLFRALNLCPLDSVKVVIIGQDPYHNVGQANGLCFSVNEGVDFPPSLRNIFKEIRDDVGAEPPLWGDLERWARQGVLMLNAVLSVRAHAPASHAKKGWEKFTDAIIYKVSQNKSGVVYMLWGSYAQRKCKVVNGSKNLILTSVHPSPLSSYRGFFGCKHFSKANEFLGEGVDW